MYRTFLFNFILFSLTHALPFSQLASDETALPQTAPAKPFTTKSSAALRDVAFENFLLQLRLSKENFSARNVSSSILLHRYRLEADKKLWIRSTPWIRWSRLTTPVPSWSVPTTDWPPNAPRTPRFWSDPITPWNPRTPDGTSTPPPPPPSTTPHPFPSPRQTSPWPLETPSPLPHRLVIFTSFSP